MGADPQYLWWRPTHFSGESPCGDSERNGMWTAVAELAIPLVCLPRYGLRAGVTVDLPSEEGSRYPRARTIHQWKPTLILASWCFAQGLTGKMGQHSSSSTSTTSKPMSLRKGDHGRGSLLAPGGLAPWGQNRTAVRHLLILIQCAAE